MYQNNRLFMAHEDIMLGQDEVLDDIGLE